MDLSKFNNVEWVIFVAEVIIFLLLSNALYKRIVEPFKEQQKRTNDLMKVKEMCDGCGSEFNYHLHNHYGYRSCSIDCDDFLDEIFTEQS